MKKFQHHTPREWWDLTKRAIVAWSDDYAPSMGAALSYYSVFSMAPLLLLVISIAGLIFGQDAARGQLFGTLQSMMGADAASAIQDMLSAMSKPSHGVTGTVISIGLLILGATTVFGELQDALDRIWRAPERSKKGGVWGMLRSRVLSFGMILGIAFLLMVSLVTTAAVSALGKWWGGFFGEWEVLLHIVNALVGFFITAAGFGLIYKYMPRVRVKWSDVMWGAVITSVLFTIGKFLIGFYIGKTGVASGFGAAGSVAVVFVWVYYSAQIFLLGAEFTWVYAQNFGSRKHAAEIAPAPEAPLRGAAIDEIGTTQGPPTLDGPAVAARSALDSDALLDGVQLTKWTLGIGAAVAVRYALPRLLAKVVASRAKHALNRQLNTLPRDTESHRRAA